MESRTRLETLKENVDWNQSALTFQLNGVCKVEKFTALGELDRI